MRKTQYIVTGKLFDSLGEACKYASFLFKISGLVVAVEEYRD